MPKIFAYFGFVFFFYSNAHEPIHVHVVKNDEDAVFDIILENGVLKRLDRRRGSRAPLNNKDAQVAETFVAKYYKNIVEKWIKFFVLKKAVRSTKITKRI